MERTVKWIRNFLIGKPTNGSGNIEFGVQNLPPINPNAKRRWSFKRSTNRETGHKLTRSVDSIDVARLGLHLPELQSRDRRSVRVVRGDSHSAAIMIQSVFRSYLARKALRALRGLVKLQAVVRGYLVRKQSRASLRCFHSLISIQSRARLHRIQMAKKTEIGFNRRKSTSFRNPNKETNDHDFNRASKSKSSHFDFPTVARIEHGLTAYYSGDISDSNQNGYIPFDVPDFVPHYMANTKSSTAKNTRSQSEPRQRPKGRPRQKSTETRPKHFGSSPNAGFDRRDPWFLKLYKGRRMDTTENESTSSGTSKSNYSRSLFLYEPPLTMY